MSPSQNHLLTTLLSLTLLFTSSPNSVLATPVPTDSTTTTPDVTKLFNGLGNIFVLNSTSYTTASLADTIGCLSDTGYLVSSSSFSPSPSSSTETTEKGKDNNCAIFSTITSYPKTISSHVGGCSFGNQAMPTNDDSRYGARQHAWNCNEDAGLVPEGERYYTVVRLFSLSFLLVVWLLVVKLV